ncbi:type II toxin-antitoxin system death-on-curing family toxin [Staphylospora marina]|uniref:type II toxin-antitoxin system death-on-curing family toxin n=1 Tax=Staphylospora marina TaxID=2490858 RepID=UPI000F5B9504|nr:type II toxin-antitoxin system death-on-curing family toxin [Staphylospora marina]
MNHEEAKSLVDRLIRQAVEQLEELEPKPDVPIDVNYLTLEEILLAHEAVMRQYDEPENGGVLHPDALKSAVRRPQMVAFEVELHPTIWHKAAALFQSIVQGHVFRNGNKRTGLTVLLYFLDKNGFYPEQLPPALAEEFTVAVAGDPRLKGEEASRILATVIWMLFHIE